MKTLATPVLLLSALLTFAASPADNLAVRSLSPPVLLPDGKEFKTWEQPLAFTRTYYVAGSSPAASDANPGTQDKPFATINKAAQVLQPGERVVVAAGIYRELIQPARGGAGPDKMISYEAGPGAQVVVKGSRIFKPQWTKNQDQPNTWQAPLDPKLFNNYNPFDIENVTPKQFEIMDWATPLRGKPPYTLVRGLVFQDGRMLTQVTNLARVSLAPGSYWVDRPGQILHIHPFGDSDPAKVQFEITTQETAFAPTQAGLGYIRVKGFVIEHAAGPWPWEQVGAISTTRGHHWLIEDNTVRWVNGVGIDLGIQHPRLPQPPQIGHHIVRRNTVTDCGICGIAGLGPGNKDFGLLIEDNVLLRNSFYDVERLYETAGIKTHNNVRCLIRRNLIMDTQHGGGIWMDWNNQFSRCMQNVIIGSKTIHGAIFVEASYEPNLVDQNFIWDTQGHGIYEHDSCNQKFANNFIGQSAKSAMLLNGKVTDRRISGRAIVGGRHQVVNNIFFSNKASSNFRGEPSDMAGNLSDGVSASFDRSILQLTWSVPPDTNVVAAPLPWITHDFWGRARSTPGIGPFGNLPSQPTRIKLWPIVQDAPPARLPE